MRRLYWASLALLCLLLFSCTTTSTASLPQAGASAEESLEILEEAYSNASGTREIVYNYAFALVSQGEGLRALEVTETYLQQNPSELRFLMLKAYIQRSLYHMESYLLTLNEILLLDPANNAVRMLRAQYYEQAGNSSAAIQDAKTVLSYEIGNNDALALLAEHDEFYAALHDTSETEETDERLKPNPLLRPEITPESFNFTQSIERMREAESPQGERHILPISTT